MTVLWHCSLLPARTLAPLRRASRRALPVHPAPGRPLRRFRRPAATPAKPGLALVCTRAATLAAPLALGPAVLPDTPPHLLAGVPLAGFGPLAPAGIGAVPDVPAELVVVLPQQPGGAASPPAAAVPEPAAAVLLLAALAFTVFTRRFTP